MIPVAQQLTDEQMQTPLFRCGECNEPVIVFAGRFFRTCEHSTASVIATPEAAKAVNAN